MCFCFLQLLKRGQAQSHTMPIPILLFLIIGCDLVQSPLDKDGSCFQSQILPAYVFHAICTSFRIGITFCVDAIGNALGMGRARISPPMRSTSVARS